MARLPQPGGDSGNWGIILNDYLDQAHKNDGTLKDNSVGSSQLQSGVIASSHLAPSLAATINDKYTKPTSGIPLADIADELDTTYASKAATVVATSGIEPGDIYQTFTKQPDGIMPATFDSGQPTAAIYGGAGNTGTIRTLAGKLTHTATGAHSIGASYYLGSLPGACTRIGARFTWKSGSTNGGTVCFAAMTGRLQAGASATSGLGIHFTLTRTAWSMQYSSAANAALQTVASGTLSKPMLADEKTAYTTEITMVNTTLYLSLPDGSVQSWDWSSHMSLVGQEIWWEHFYNNAPTDDQPQFISIWADSGRQQAPQAQHFLPWRYAFTTPPGEVVTPVAANTPVAIPNISSGATIIPGPPSGKIIVRVATYMTGFAASNVRLDLQTDGASFDYQADWVGMNVTGDRKVETTFFVQGLTPYGTYQLTPLVFSTTACSLYANPGSGFHHTMVVESVD